MKNEFPCTTSLSLGFSLGLLFCLVVFFIGALNQRRNQADEESLDEAMNTFYANYPSCIYNFTDSTVYEYRDGTRKTVTFNSGNNPIIINPEKLK